MTLDVMEEIMQHLDTPFRRRSRDIVVNISRYNFITESKLTAYRMSLDTGLELHDVKLVLAGERASEEAYTKIGNYVSRLLTDARKKELFDSMAKEANYRGNISFDHGFSVNSQSSFLTFNVDGAMIADFSKVSVDDEKINRREPKSDGDSKLVYEVFTHGEYKESIINVDAQQLSFNQSDLPITVVN